MKLPDKNISRFGVPDWAGTAVLFLTFAFCINFMNRAVLGPFLVHMRADLGLDPAQAASLLSFMSIGMGCGMLCSGALASLLAPRRLISLSLAMAGAALFLISRAEGLGEARVYFLLLGITSGFYMPSAMATLATLVRPESWSRAVAVHELAPCLSFIVAPVLAETAAALWGWRHGTLLMGCASVAVGVVFLKMRGGDETPSPAFHRRSCGRLPQTCILDNYLAVRAERRGGIRPLQCVAAFVDAGTGAWFGGSRPAAVVFPVSRSFPGAFWRVCGCLVGGETLLAFISDCAGSGPDLSFAAALHDRNGCARGRHGDTGHGGGVCFSRAFHAFRGIVPAGTIAHDYFTCHSTGFIYRRGDDALFTRT